MNLITENKQDEITFQMGLNLRQYQEIEQIIKQLILVSSQTFKVTSGINDDNEIFEQPKLDFWSNRANLERATLGNLLTQLEQTQHEPNYKEHDDIHAVQVSLNYHIPLIVFFDIDKFERDFKQIVADRNQFIHHFDSISKQDDDLLTHLKSMYQRAESFKQEHLIPCSEQLKKSIKNCLDKMIEIGDMHIKNWNRLTAFDIFEETYHKNKRSDDWADWAILIQDMQKNHPDTLMGLRKKSSFSSKNTTWTKIIQECYPRWQFMEEYTKKGGKRLLVKVDNSEIALQDKHNTLVMSEADQS